MLKFTIDAKVPNGRGRAGTIQTPHGIIETPAFIPVGTKATLKALTPEQVRDAVGAQAILANTYHLYLQPGTEVLEKAGGLGKFMNWQGPTFTDSGGFQAFSLGGAKNDRKSKIAKGTVEGALNDLDENEIRNGGSFENGDENEKSLAEKIPMATVDDDGVTFRSIIDGSSHKFTPERSIEIQHSIGADIIFAFDECLLPLDPYEKQKKAVHRTFEWAKRCLVRHKELNAKKSAISLLGIVQGGRHEDLRKESARTIGAMDFDGFGIGGSFDKEDIGIAVGWVCDELPENKPRHLLGIGEPADLILGIENGIDTFDCVAPTRLGRNGSAYTHAGRINLLNAKYILDFTPIDPKCGCYACTKYTRAYIAHLFRAKEMLAATLTSIHNLYFLVNLVKEARKAIVEGKWEEFKSERSKL